jgi:hypothetical protein
MFQCHIRIVHDQTNDGTEDSIVNVQTYKCYKRLLAVYSMLTNILSLRLNFQL